MAVFLFVDARLAENKGLKPLDHPGAVRLDDPGELGAPRGVGLDDQSRIPGAEGPVQGPFRPVVELARPVRQQGVVDDLVFRHERGVGIESTAEIVEPVVGNNDVGPGQGREQHVRIDLFQDASPRQSEVEDKDPDRVSLLQGAAIEILLEPQTEAFGKKGRGAPGRRSAEDRDNFPVGGTVRQARPVVRVAKPEGVGGAAAQFAAKPPLGKEIPPRHNIVAVVEGDFVEDVRLGVGPLDSLRGGVERGGAETERIGLVRTPGNTTSIWTECQTSAHQLKRFISSTPRSPSSRAI